MLEDKPLLSPKPPVETPTTTSNASNLPYRQSLSKAIEGVLDTSSDLCTSVLGTMPTFTGPRPVMMDESDDEDDYRPPTIDEKLPPELLGMMCTYLSRSEVSGFRLVNRAFYHGAHQAYCEALNERSSVMTCNDVRTWKSLTKKMRCGVYIKRLRIDVQVACKCQLPAFWMATVSERSIALAAGLTTFAESNRRLDHPSTCVEGLVKILRRMPNLRTIELGSYKQRTAAEADKFHGFVDSPVSTVSKVIVSKFAATRTLGAVTQAFRRNAPLPRITTFAADGALPIESLPDKFTTMVTHGLFDHLTTLRLKLAPGDTGSDILTAATAANYVPNFMKGLPPTIQDLSLAFPRDSFGHRLPSSFIPPFYGDFGFEAILAHKIYFPALSTLRFAELSLTRVHLLEQFLLVHKPSLRTFRNTNLALGSMEWRPFVRFLGACMELDRLEFDLDMDEHEEAMNIAYWKSRPQGTRPSREDFRCAAKETSVNGVRIEKKCVERRESGYAADCEDEVPASL